MSRRRHTVYANLPRESEAATAAARLVDFICSVPENNGHRLAPLVTETEIEREFRKEQHDPRNSTRLTAYATGKPKPRIWRMVAELDAEKGAPPLVASATVLSPDDGRAGTVIITMDAAPAFPMERWENLTQQAQECAETITENGTAEAAGPMEAGAPETLSDLMGDQNIMVVITHDGDTADESDLRVALHLAETARYTTMNLRTQMRLLRNMDYAQSHPWLESSRLWLTRDLYDHRSVTVTPLPESPNEAIDFAHSEIEKIRNSTEYAAMRAMQDAMDRLDVTTETPPSRTQSKSSASTTCPTGCD
jgi:hypothetical protein